MSKWACSGITTYAQRSNACICLARSIASTSHIRLRSLDRNGRRQKQENVNAWACPASLNRRHAFRCSSIARQDSRSVAASSAATTFCRNSEDMPTQSRWAWHPACRGESCRVHDLSPGNEQETICSYERSAVKKKLLPFRRVPCPTARRGHVFNPAVSEAATTGPGEAARSLARATFDLWTETVAGKSKRTSTHGRARFIESSTRFPVFVHSEARLAEYGCKLCGDHILP